MFNGTANLFTRLLGYAPTSEDENTHTEGEIRMLVRESARRGMLEVDEEEMVGAVFELNDTVAREIMVPRDLAREVLVVPENRTIDGILEDFQRQELQLAIVIDEWGSFEGLFTLEDIIEEIVGEIRDEFDEEEPAVYRLPDGSYSIDGRIPIGVVNEALSSAFESEDFDTIGGLVLGHLGRVPEVGHEVRLDGYLLRVDEVDGPRVAQVIVRASPEEERGDEQAAEEPSGE